MRHAVTEKFLAGALCHFHEYSEEIKWRFAVEFTAAVESRTQYLTSGCQYSPETQLPLKRSGVNSCPRISCSLKRWPLTLGPSSGGVSSTTDVTINASTITMTSSAIRIPRQLRWLGLLDTNSWHKWKPIRHVHAITESVDRFSLREDRLSEVGNSYSGAPGD